MILRIIYSIFSFLLLIYLVWPGPNYVEDFSSLPKSMRSTEPGDTYQVRNIKAYYSDFFREFVVPYYQQNYQNLSRLPFPPIRLNYPPESALTMVREQILSTYLEELVYPMKTSVFVNGFEPFYSDGRPKYKGAVHIREVETVFNSKTTLRFYPSPIWARFVIWVGINIILLCLWNYWKKVLTDD